MFLYKMLSNFAMKYFHGYHPHSICGVPYTQFLEWLIMLMAKNIGFLDKTITVKESLEIVKELIGFFIGKLQIIQGKLKKLY